jgi:hypothetical protein
LVHCSISGHQLNQSCGFKSQSRDWACCILSNCPGSRGGYCILQEVAKIMISKGGHAWQKKKDKYVTSEAGWKSGISSRQKECTGSLKIWSWSSCHQVIKKGWAIVVGTGDQE